jgi:hypothetical protein
MAASIINVEDFDPAEWKIEREGREWRGEEFHKRIYQAPEIEYVGGIFVNERQRLTVLAMLLEKLESIKLSGLETWKTGKPQSPN